VNIFPERGINLSELRYDPFRKNWVIIAADRGTRPTSFSREEGAGPAGQNCAFCPGNESMTPPETYAIRQAGTRADTPGWSVRVVTNKYPALSPDQPLLPMEPGLYANIPAFGSHEVIIETTSHTLQMADLPPERIADVLKVYRRRVYDFFCDERVNSILIFKNHGAEAGASLAHAHTQLVALPFTPRSLQLEVEAFAENYQETGTCLLCRMVQDEVKDGHRVVSVDRGFVVFSPYASQNPFETWIVPEKHDHYFKSITDDGCLQLARVLRSVLKRLKDEFSDPPFNMVLHTAPAGVEQFHWHIEIIPRLTRPGGFELGSGVMINTVAPEEAAEVLRGA
jgi:UDPglucose--hexose-1-phosphate uridylyltransferase